MIYGCRFVAVKEPVAVYLGQFERHARVTEGSAESILWPRGRTGAKAQEAQTFAYDQVAQSFPRRLRLDCTRHTHLPHFWVFRRPPQRSVFFKSDDPARLIRRA